MSPARHEVQWLTRIARVAALAGVVVLAACGGPSAPGNGESLGGDHSTITDPAGPAAAFVALPGAGALALVATASIFETAQLWIAADWKGAPADGAEQVVITAPDGSVYQSTQISFGESSRGDVQIQVLPDGTRRVALAFQIWGTSVEQLTRTGTWSAEVTLVGGGAHATTSVDLRE